MLVLIFFGVQIVKKILAPNSIAKLLPADETVLFVEFNISETHQQVERAFNILKGYPQFSLKKIKTLSEEKLGVNYDLDIKPWIGRRAGVVMLAPDKADFEDQLSTVYFAEITDPQLAQQFLDNLVMDLSGFHTAFLDEYLLFGNDQKAIDKLINLDHKNRLSQTSKFRKITNNLPLNKLGFIYVNYQNEPEYLGGPLSFFAKKLGIDPSMVNIASSFLDSEGIGIIALDDKFVLQSFLNINTENLKDSDFRQNKKYTADLTRFIDENVLAFWGGQDLEFQIKRMLMAFTEGNEDVQHGIDGLMRTYTNSFFGSQVNLNTDVFPFLNDEYLIALENYNDQQSFKIILNIGQDKEKRDKLTWLIDRFADNGASYDTEVRNYQLPDGTNAQELVAVNKEITKTNSTYSDVVINQIAVGGKERGIYYAFLDEQAIVTDSLESLHHSIDLYFNPDQNFQNAKYFTTSVTPILRNADQISYIALDQVFDYLFGDQLPLALEPLSAFSSGKNYFNDGISTVSYIELR